MPVPLHACVQGMLCMPLQMCVSVVCVSHVPVCSGVGNYLSCVCVVSLCMLHFCLYMALILCWRDMMNFGIPTLWLLFLHLPSFSQPCQSDMSHA